ncbi:zinc finger, CCHC-type containing protein [Tanacetum coccineum]
MNLTSVNKYYHGSKCWFKDVLKRHNQTGQNGWDELYTLEGKDEISVNRVQEKYTAEKEEADKFITFKFFEFAMEDNVSILDQVHEFLILVSKFKNLNIEIPEKLLVGAIITKLPSSWHNYRKKLMHTSEDFTLDQIQKHLRIEEETRIREKNLNGASSSKVNYVDSGKNNKGNDKKRKGTWNSSKNNKKDKKPLSEVVCYKCGEKGHIKRYCKNPKKKNQNSNKKDESANAVEQELHMASVTTTDDWWYDSSATAHVCNNRDLFKTYKETEDVHEVMMGDNHTSKVIGSGNVEIQFTSGKKLTLMNVLHVLNIRKNLVSGFKLCKSGIKVVIESDKMILSKANVFLGKAYTYVYLLKSKDQAFETFKIYKAEVETQKGKMIQILRSDRGDEYFSTEFSSYCESQESSSAPRRSERARKERNLDPDFIDSQAIIFLVEGDNKNNVVNKIPFLLNVEDAPKTYKVAMTSRNSAFWKEAINDEMDSLMDPLKLLKLDDILIVGTNMEGINETKKFLSSCFQMKDMNKVDTILQIKVKRHSEGYALNQCHYIDKIIDKFQHLNIEEENTLYESSCKLVENNGRAVAQIKYASVIGINETKKFMSSCFQMKDMNEVDTILGIKVKRHSGGYALNQCHYIDKIIDKFQHLNIEEANTPYESSCKLVENNGRAVAQIEYASAIGYSDASWITGSSDSKSTTGWIFTLGGGAVCWGSKKQTCITHSTMEAEFLALAAAGKEAEWLRNMLLDIELWPQPMPAISLHCDSQSTLSRAYNKVYNGKSRHISLRHAYIKELISNGIITIEYIRSCKNLADPFTKGLPKDIVFGTTREMGLKPIE